MAAAIPVVPEAVEATLAEDTREVAAVEVSPVAEDTREVAAVEVSPVAVDSLEVEAAEAEAVDGADA